MNPPDRPDGALAPWSPPSLPATAAPAAWEDPAQEAPQARMFSPRLVLRALRRHWWQILALWAVGTAGMSYLALTRIKPLYSAEAWLTVEPGRPGILTGGTGGAGEFGPYLETQVLLITSPDVLAEAIRRDDVKDLPKITGSLEPETDLRREIAVGVPNKGAHLIKVAMTGERPKEITAIVNAVVDAYLAKAKTWSDEAMSDQLKTLGESKKEFEKQVLDWRQKVRDLTRKAEAIAAPDQGKDPREVADRIGKAQLTLEGYRALNQQLWSVRIDRQKAESTVKYLENEARARNVAPIAARGGDVGDGGDDLEQRVRDEFMTLPEAARLLGEWERAQDKLKKVADRVKNRRDPTYKRVATEERDAKADYDDYWALMRPTLLRRAREGGGPGRPPADPEAARHEGRLADAQIQLNALRVHERELERQIKDAEVRVTAANTEIVDLQFARDELRNFEATLALVQKHIDQTELDAKDISRVKLRAKAHDPRLASSDNRMKIVMAAPVLMFVLSCLLFTLLEFRSGRVADPDELSKRIRVGVLGVVPPLPSPAAPGRALTARGVRDERRRVEEFVQSLDHLRVTLCAPRAGQSDRRCVLITSATGGEGKTTLAAQLAGRCANAGLMTLLIDADLRRPSLGDLLEVPEGPGLVDVLTGDAPPEAAMVVIGNAGGFHLLPAGTLGQDPSRLLHGDRLGRLIAQFRETFDMVIIDAPPVLAVPDALLLGRWTDGAVLAVRHDASRFPLVERANKRLASVGVPVLGAVVNGCRTMESAYGSYRYTPYAAADAPGGEAEAI